jgi:hypothetical protein|nr:MAG TPA: hypothetical protein [Caudoviricetes sp.]
MNEEFVELVKKSMVNPHLYDGLESASIRLNGNIFHGHILRFKGGDNYLFISNTENDRLFHSSYFVFGSSVFRDRCLWVDESDLTYVGGGMLI